NGRLQIIVENIRSKVVQTRAAPLHLNELGGREDRTHETEVENVFAIVTGGHHAHGDTDARLAGAVCVDEVGRAEQIVVREVYRELLCAGDAAGDLHGEIGLVLVR